MLTLGLKFVLHSSLLLFLFSCFPEKNNASDIQFHTLHISSEDSSASECRRPSTTGPHQMEVVDMTGACAPQQNQRRPNLAETLHLDQLRAESIQARLKPTDHQLQNANKVMKSKDEQANLTVRLQTDVTLDSFHYIVRLNVLGGQPLSLVLDTGHGLTLTQTCSDHSPIRCFERVCFDFVMDLGQYPIPNPCEQGHNCDYDLVYHEMVVNTGTLSRLNLIHFPGFVFGCGSGPRPIFGYGVDGVLGLGSGKLSFMSQTNHTRFAYCLPSNSSSTGYLTFDKNNTHDNNGELLLFTPFTTQLPHELHYIIDIVAITVGKTQLQINYQSDIIGTVIETRSLITQLPQAAYNKMRDEFKLQMGTNYPAAESFSILDTCYDTTNRSSITVPPMSFTFGNNVTVDLDVSGILFVVNSTLSCFAFASSTSDDTGFAIFGSVQQRTLEMVFDVENKMIGFGHNGCA